MKEVSPQVHAALLGVLAAPEADHTQTFQGLLPEQWQSLGSLAARTRSAPLLNHVLSRCQGVAAVPPDVAEQLASIARSKALISLNLGKVLAQVLAALRKRKMFPIALKGTALAFRDYPQPQLRPLRDIDLLLPVEEAVAARELLLSDHGFEPHPAAGIYGPDHTHQLPEIRHVDSGVVIELHHRINASGWTGEARLLEMIRQESEEIALLGELVRVPSATANFLHLVEHAGLHHLFSNGPLILSDLHFLAARHALDWEKVRATAAHIGLERSLLLIASIARSHGASWVPASFEKTDANLINSAEYAMLCDDETSRRHAQMLRHLERSGGTNTLASGLARAIRPDPDELARIAGHPADSPKRWLGYLAWLREKGSRFLASRKNVAFQSRQVGYSSLSDWLKSDA